MTSHAFDHCSIVLPFSAAGKRHLGNHRLISLGGSVVKRGVVYALSHPAWLDETLMSAATVRRHMPDLARQLYATRDLIDQVRSTDADHFTELITLDTLAHSHRPRFESMLETGLDQALFVDGDTYFVDQTYELFEVLELFDIAMAPAPQYFHPRSLREGIHDRLPRVSQALPEWNSGVIAANVTAACRDMVREWMRLFAICRAEKCHTDQPALRVALAMSRLRIATLPANYNFRANMPQVVNRRVKILHAHGDLEQIAGYINGSETNRSYVPNKQEIHGFYPKGLTRTKSG